MDVNDRTHLSGLGNKRRDREIADLENTEDGSRRSNFWFDME